MKIREEEEISDGGCDGGLATRLDGRDAGDRNSDGFKKKNDVNNLIKKITITIEYKIFNIKFEYKNPIHAKKFTQLCNCK